MDNVSAASSGDTMKALEELRDTLALLLDTTDAQVHAQLSGQYVAVLEKIDERKSSTAPKSIQDDLKAQRTKRKRELRAKTS